MQKIIEFLQTLVIDAEGRTKLLLTLLHLPALGILAFLVRQERSLLIRRAHNRALLFVLDEFRNFCRHQANVARQYLSWLDTGPGNGEIPALAAIKTSRHLQQIWLVLLQNPSIFFYQRYAMKAGVKLFELRDQVAYHQEHTSDCIHHFSQEYHRFEKQYKENLSALAAMYDSLQESLNRKTLNKNATPDWADNYLKIFTDWQAAGAQQQMAITRQAIINRVLQLTYMYTDISFIIRAGELAFTCDSAYNEMQRLTGHLREQLSQLAWHNRLSYRMAALLMKKMNFKVPARKIVPRPGWLTERRLRIIEHDLHKLGDFETGIGRARHLNKTFIVLIALLLALSIALTLYSLTHKKSRPVYKAPVAVLKDSATTTKPAFTHVHTPFVFVQQTDSVFGIDISRYQGDLMKDINTMDTLHFVICKATEGVDYVDPDFFSNWHLIRRKGLVRGAYHFYQNSDDPIRQAEHFIAMIRDLDSLDLPPVLDIEEISLKGPLKSAGLKNNLLLFLEHVAQRTKRKPMIYTDLFFADTYLNSSAFSDYPLWLAEYSGNNRPRLPQAWKGKQYVIWQKKDNYKIDSHNADFDVFNGNDSALFAFLQKY